MNQHPVAVFLIHCVQIHSREPKLSTKPKVTWEIIVRNSSATTSFDLFDLCSIEHRAQFNRTSLITFDCSRPNRFLFRMLCKSPAIIMWELMSLALIAIPCLDITIWSSHFSSRQARRYSRSFRCCILTFKLYVDLIYSTCVNLEEGLRKDREHEN